MTTEQKSLGFPSVSALTRALKFRQKSIRDSMPASDLRDCEPDNPGVDCRLRVHNGRWNVLTGDSSGDQDHRGVWACGFLPYGRTNLSDLARQLIVDAE
jgi:hypothetical protein